MPGWSKQNNIKGAIFDLDGTLFDSLWIWEEIDKMFLKRRGFSVPPDYAAAIGALNFRETAEYTIKRFGLYETPEALMDEWTDMAREFYEHDVALKPFAAEFLRKLKGEGIKLAVATSSSRELYMPALVRCGIYELFDVIADTSEHRSKEFPDIYLHAAKQMGLAPDSCAVIEDLPAALACAFDAGFKTIAIPDKHTDSAAKAHLFVPSFQKLAEIF